LICRAVGGDTVALCPPLVIDGAGINLIFDALAKALDRTTHWLAAEHGIRLAE